MRKKVRIAWYFMTFLVLMVMMVKPIRAEEKVKCNLSSNSYYYKIEYAYRSNSTKGLSDTQIQFYNGIKPCLDAAYKFSGDEYREKAVHDYIVTHCEYDYDNYLSNTIPDSSCSAEGVFVTHKAVCSGYSLAFKLCMDILGIQNEYITGVANNGTANGNHSWNAVCLNKKWYLVDCTWDDPVYLGVDKDPNYISYSFFNITDSVMKINHTYNWDKQATGTEYNIDYYKNNATPVLKSIENSTKGITIKWNRTKEATGYIVYRKSQSEKQYSKIATIKKGTTTKYTDKSVKTKNGITYSYMIKAVGPIETGIGSNMLSQIRLTTPTIKSLANNKSKKTVVKWNKNKKVDGYIVHYSQNKEFKSKVKGITIKNKSTITKTIKNLKKGKTYYFRIRSYKTVDGVKIYSAWSNVTKIKIKK